MTGATSVVSMADLFGLYLQRGLVEVALLGGAQIDRFGNLNTTVIGNYSHPKVRLPGSGGACEIAVNAQRVFYIMQLKKRAFVEHLDFLTSPGHLQGGTTRQEQGIPGQGPELLITDKAIFNFANEARKRSRLALSRHHPGTGAGRDRLAGEIGQTHFTDQPAHPRRVAVIRVQLDPNGMYSRSATTA